MRIFISLALVFSFIFASMTSLKDKSLIYLFKHRYYTYICMNRWVFIDKYSQKREDLLALVAYSCLKKHYLTPALDLAKILRTTKDGRINATYLDTLFLVKLLIIRYIEDGYDLNSVSFPHLEGDDLGKVFYLIKKEKPKPQGNSVVVKGKKYTYKITFVSKVNNLVLDVYENGKLVKKEKYW